MPEVINLSSKILKNNGVFVSKAIMEDFIEVSNLAKSLFKNVNFLNLKQVKVNLKETYLHCKIIKRLYNS